MATPLLIDTDMGIDDAVAVSLALTSNRFDLRAVVGVGGCVGVDQVMVNIGRFFRAMNLSTRPVVARGLDHARPGLRRPRDAIDEGGSGFDALPADETIQPVDFRTAYRQAIEGSAGELAVVTTGPLSNLAAILAESPDLAKSIKHVHVSGGAIWTRGDATEAAEFNFHCDAPACATVMSSALPITVAPLDVGRLICLDESHVARLASSGARIGEIVAELLRDPLSRPDEPGPGKTYIHDAVAIGGAMWPGLFLRTRMRLDVETGGSEAGRCRPALGGDRARHVNILTTVNAVDFVENLLESLCHEEFVV